MGEAKRRKRNDYTWGKGLEAGDNIHVCRLPDSEVDPETLALWERLSDEQPNINFACVRISEGGNSAVGVAWYRLRRKGGRGTGDFKVQSGILFGRAVASSDSLQWVKDGSKPQWNGQCRFNPAIEKWAKNNLKSADLLIEVV